MEFYDNREHRYESVNMKDVSSEKSQVQNFYTGKIVLVTGATGFLGTLLIEKLLRKCSDVKMLILIVREKNGKTPEERINDLFSEEVFYKVKQDSDDYGLKLKVLEGDCEQTDFGLKNTAEVRQLLESVDIVFHLAGNVHLNDTFRNAYQSNTLTANNAFKLIEKMTSLKAFVYVSTLYSHGEAELIWFTEEKIRQCLKFNDSTLACFLPKLLKGSPNTFIFSKSVGEILANDYIHRYPVIIYRLPFVSPTMEEPLTCWTRHLTGVADVLTATGTGFVRTLICDRNSQAAIAPADRVINGLICLPLHFDKNKNKARSIVHPSIYNFAASQNDSLTWLNAIQKLKKAQSGAASSSCCPHSMATKCTAHWLLKYYLCHLLPVLILSLIKGFNQQVVSLWKEYVVWFEKSKNYTFFTVESCTDKSPTNTIDLINNSSLDDKIIFNCDTSLDWDDYFFNLTKFFDNYINQFNLDAYKIRQENRTLQIIDKVIIAVVRGFLLWIAYYSYIKVYNILNE